MKFDYEIVWSNDEKFIPISTVTNKKVYRFSNSYDDYCYRIKCHYICGVNKKIDPAGREIIVKSGTTYFWYAAGVGTIFGI